MKGTTMLNKLTLALTVSLMLTCAVAAHAADSRTSAQKCADRRMSQVLAWQVIAKCIDADRVDRPSDTPAEWFVGAGRDGYLSYARSEERGEERNSPAAVQYRLAELVGDEPSKQLEETLERCVELDCTGSTADLQVALAAVLYDRLPTYRDLLTKRVVNADGLTAALAECLMAGQAIKMLVN